MLAHQRPEPRHQYVHVIGIGHMSVNPAPLGGNLRIVEQTANMIDLGLAHVSTRKCLIERNALGPEGLDQRPDRRFASKVHHCSGPVKNDQIKACLESHAVTPASSKLVITSSPIAKPVEAPAPQVTIATLTCASGASISIGRSLADA